MLVDAEGDPEAALAAVTRRGAKGRVLVGRAAPWRVACAQQRGAGGGVGERG
jgi:hypothetical protein